MRAPLEFISRITANNAAADPIDLLQTAGWALLESGCETAGPPPSLPTASKARRPTTWTTKTQTPTTRGPQLLRNRCLIS